VNCETQSAILTEADVQLKIFVTIIEEDGQIKTAQLINILGALPPGSDFRKPLERLEKHIN